MKSEVFILFGNQFWKLLLLCMMLLAIRLPGQNPVFTGPFHSEGMTFYLPHAGGDLEISVRVFKTAPGFRGTPPLKVTPAATLTLSDPDDRQVEFKYWRMADDQKEQCWVFRRTNATPGVWKLRNAFSTCGNLALELRTAPEIKFGVLFSRCKMLTEDLNNFRQSYFLVPPAAAFPPAWIPGAAKLHAYTWNIKRQTDPEQLHIHNRGVQTQVFDASGRPMFSCDIYEITGARLDLYGNAIIDLPFGYKELQIPVRGVQVTLSDSAGKTVLQLTPDNGAAVGLKQGEIYSMSITGKAEGYLTFDGFPIILCPDAETARKIGGDMTTATDGLRYPHRFQIKLLEWIHSLQKSDLEIAVESMEKYRQEWLADPANAALMPIFAYAEHILHSQKIDPAHPEFGSAEMNFHALTFLYSTKKPFNPYYGNKALEKRLLLHFIRKWLYLTEGGTFQDGRIAAEWTGYDAMAFVNDYIAFAMMAPLAEKKVMELWLEALRLPVHRLGMTRLGSENQSLHWVVKLYALHKATADPIYLDMARNLLRDTADVNMSNSMATGYPMEGFGVDATYTGISTAMLAFCVLFSGDDAAIPILERVYNLMNHSVAREPDGRLIGVTGFAHRTLGSWCRRQYHGGNNLLADRMKSAAVLATNKVPDAASAEQLFSRYARIPFPKDFDQWMQKEGIEITRYFFSEWEPVWYQSIFPIGAKLEDAKLPHESQECFEKDFNGEFHARRTAEYYAFLYTGNPCWRDFQWREIELPFQGLTRLVDGKVHSKHVAASWMPMQGINLFWTPGFGTFVAARNWSMYTQNLIRLDRDGKVADFQTSYSASSRKSDSAIELEHRSKFLGVTFRRRIMMQDDALEVQLDIEAPEIMQPHSVIEQLPFLQKPDLQFAWIENGIAQPLPGKNATALRASTPNGAVLLNFSRPINVRRGYDSELQGDLQQQHGLLELEISDSYDGSGKLEFSYSITGEKRK